MSNPYPFERRHAFTAVDKTSTNHLDVSPIDSSHSKCGQSISKSKRAYQKPVASVSVLFAIDQMVWDYIRVKRITMTRAAIRTTIIIKIGSRVVVKKAMRSAI